MHWKKPLIRFATLAGIALLAAITRPDPSFIFAPFKKPLSQKRITEMTRAQTCQNAYFQPLIKHLIARDRRI